jgi:hypothetical protein
VLVSAGFCTSLAEVSVLAEAEGAAADSVLVPGVDEAAGADCVLELVACDADALASGVVLVAGAAVSVLVEGVLCAVVLVDDCEAAEVSVEADALVFGCIVMSFVVEGEVEADWLEVVLPAAAMSASLALPVGAGDADEAAVLSALSVVAAGVDAPLMLASEDDVGHEPPSAFLMSATSSSCAAVAADVELPLAPVVELLLAAVLSPGRSTPSAFTEPLISTNLPRCSLMSLSLCRR